ncbi:dTMP kinase [Methylococcus sp. EFPC2]|uniref:dTMP kinase n=1 Tax=Methylococcus sp. EFPC2 TaxID=2812648 RepID=UPI001967D342|nr:dTMP kinase [Methylococcus sp. EFPC2]QSA97397.1 dTMP kinase [Methylococcus sp. EFPC2]
MTRGKFITLEGGEGLGKSTNLAFVRDQVEKAGHPAIATREPGGTRLGEAVRALLLGSDAIDPRAELLLLFAARAQHIHEVIEPALAAGHWVVCDRFTDASYAYQGAGRGLERAFIESLERHVQAGLSPDLTLLFDAPVDIGLARVRARGESDRFERERVDFFERIRAAYLDQARRFPGRVRLVDASQPLASVQDAIARHLNPWLGT